MMNSTTDRIERAIVIDAPIARVWRAIADSNEFGQWFGVRFDRAFAPGTHIVGHITPTVADPYVAEMQAKYDGARFEMWVERIEPLHTFSFRWHPFAIDPNVDYSSEPMTLVTFTLEAEGGDKTTLSVTETGFDALPAHRRGDAFEANGAGWELQVQMIQKYLAMNV
jgi:uncharacterized protein YndB with AHSA1/START domain